MQVLFAWMSLCSSKHETISNHYLKVAICTLIAQVIYMGNIQQGPSGYRSGEERWPEQSAFGLATASGGWMHP